MVHSSNSSGRTVWSARNCFLPVALVRKRLMAMGIALSFCYICVGAGARRALAGDRISVDDCKRAESSFFE